MYKFFHKNFISYLLLGILISSCNSKKENFDLDFSNFKIPPKNNEKILNLESPESLVTKKEIIKNELKNWNKKDQRFSAKNYKEYIDSFVGPTLRKMFFEKYPKKIWGIDTKFMTPDWAPNRIKFRNKIFSCIAFINVQYFGNYVGKIFLVWLFS